MKEEPDPFEEDLVRAARSVPPAGGDCIAPERLVELQTGTLSEADAEPLREHLARCSACAAAARDAGRFVEVMNGWSGQPVAHPPPAKTRRWWFAAAAGIAAVALGLFAYRFAGPSPGDPAARWRDVTIAKASYPLVNPTYPDEGLLWRGGASGGMAVPEGFHEAMEAYTSGDLDEAARELAGVVKAAPNHGLSRFYFGVTLLLLDRPDEAVAHLERAASVGDERGWYLALALLKSGQEERAAEILECRASWREDPHRDEAEALLKRIGPPGGEGRRAPCD